ncbi:MAG: hypothetical protein K2W85_04495 [Phycisphaerales bacterium]|nr:hypothetical protein [Phycisphaerales bacterium]
MTLGMGLLNSPFYIIFGLVLGIAGLLIAALVLVTGAILTTLLISEVLRRMKARPKQSRIPLTNGRPH